MVAGRHTDQQGVPGVVDLFIRQLRVVESATDVIPEFCFAYQALLKIPEYFILRLVTVKSIRISYTQVGPGLPAFVKIKAKNYIAVIKNDIFDVIHKANILAANMYISW